MDPKFVVYSRDGRRLICGIKWKPKEREKPWNGKGILVCGGKTKDRAEMSYVVGREIPTERGDGRRWRSRIKVECKMSHSEFSEMVEELKKVFDVQTVSSFRRLMG